MSAVRRTACDKVGIDADAWVGPWRRDQYVSGGVWVRRYHLGNQMYSVTLTQLQNGTYALSWMRP